MLFIILILLYSYLVVQLKMASSTIVKIQKKLVVPNYKLHNNTISKELCPHLVEIAQVLAYSVNFINYSRGFVYRNNFTFLFFNQITVKNETNQNVLYYIFSHEKCAFLLLRECHMESNQQQQNFNPAALTLFTHIVPEKLQIICLKISR